MALAGETFFIIGFSQKEYNRICEEVKDAGGKVAFGATSKVTKVVVPNKNKLPKMTKAALMKEIIDKTELTELMNGTSSASTSNPSSTSSSKKRKKSDEEEEDKMDVDDNGEADDGEDEVSDEEEVVVKKTKKKEEDNEAKGKGGKEKMVTKVVKGRAAVDSMFPSGKATVYASQYHVLDEGGAPYDALLNQTNITQNNNKYYIIQVLEKDTGGSYYLWTRWGRVGEKGQCRADAYGNNKAGAIAGFKSKFQSKTKNKWENRENFIAVFGKYTYLIPDYGSKADGDDSDGEEASSSSGGGAGKGKAKEQKVKIPESKLDKRVQDFVSLIADVKMMEKQMVQLGYDAKKMPLGKLSKVTIQKGFEVLKKIAALLDGNSVPTKSQLAQLSSEFYTVVPHDFGRNIPPIIGNKQDVKLKLEMCESLADIQVAQTILKATAYDMNPIDETYQKLKIDMTPMDKGSSDFKLLQEYITNTHGHTHTMWQLEIDEAFVVSRHGEEESFQAFANNPNRQLLWHGSRLTNFVGILSQGLRIAPPEAPVTGYMFDKGVYFADSVSKSAQYCCASQQASTGVILLCEVALGDLDLKQHADYNAKKNRPPGKLSVKGVGRYAPDDNGSKIIPDNVKVPCGKLKDAAAQTGAGLSLQYNEYIVYDTSQIRMRYAIKLKFKFKKGGGWF